MKLKKTDKLLLGMLGMLIMFTLGIGLIFSGVYAMAHGKFITGFVVLFLAIVCLLASIGASDYIRD